jgi:type IV pilus assembly protein PilV
MLLIMPSYSSNLFRSATRHQKGATLIEILVTMLIVSFALLGIAGMQLTSIRYSQSSSFREVAVNLAQGMSERIRTNTAALAEATDSSAYRANNAYAAATTVPNDPACGLGAAVCTAAQSAQRDLREWRQALQQELPGGRGAIQAVATGGLTSPTARRLVVMWVEKAKDSDDNVSAAPTDTNCPTPRVAGVRCFTMVVQP